MTNKIKLFEDKKNPHPFNNGRELLTHAGKISHQLAMEKSSQALEKYQNIQKEINKKSSFEQLEQDINKLKQ